MQNSKSIFSYSLRKFEVKELNIRCTAAYSKPYQSSKMELYAKIVNDLLRGYLFYEKAPF